MFRKILLFMILILSISLFAPVSAQVQTEKFGSLVDAAQFFPSSTPIYFAIRTDGEYINTLNDVFVQIQERTVGAALSIPAGLDMAFDSIFGSDFQNDVAPWLGNFVAVGIFPMDLMIDYTSRNDKAEFGVIINITSRDSATEFVSDFFTKRIGGDIRQERGDDFTTFYAGDYDDTRFVITDEYLTITNTDKLALPQPLQGSLFNTYAFEDALNPLPADAYNFVGYVDIATLQSYLSATRDYYYYRNQRFMDLLLVQTIGPIAFAGNIENGNVLVVDTVFSAGNMIGMEQLGLSMPPDLTVTPEFANVIPSDAIVAVHGVSPLAYGDYFRDSALAVWRYLSASEFNPEYDANIEEWVNQGYVGLGRVADAIFSNLTGLSLERDFANWMSSDGVFFMRSNPELDNPQFPIDLAFVSQVTDGTQSLESIRRLVRALPLTLRSLGVRGVVFTETTLEGADALIMEIHGYEISTKPVLELVISANETVFAIGTHRAVADVLAGRTGGAFPASQAYILPDANMVLYDNVTNALPLARWIVAQSGANSQRDLVERIVNLIGEGVISTTILDNGTMVVRSAQILNLGR